MIRISDFIHSKTGRRLMSIILGLGIAGLFKMSCDNRSCIVYQGPEFDEKKHVVKVNDKCYDVKENLIDCKNSNQETVYM